MVCPFVGTIPGNYFVSFYHTISSSYPDMLNVASYMAFNFFWTQDDMDTCKGSFRLKLTRVETSFTSSLIYKYKYEDQMSRSLYLWYTGMNWFRFACLLNNLDFFFTILTLFTQMDLSTYLKRTKSHKWFVLSRPGQSEEYKKCYNESSLYVWWPQGALNENTCYIRVNWESPK